MHAYTLTGATLHDAFRLGLLPARPMQDTAQTPPNARSNKRSESFGQTIAGQLVAALKSRQAAFTRLELANQTGLSKSTVANHIEDLVQRGLVLRERETMDGRVVYLYRLPTATPNPIRRSPYYWWKRCPSCDADRKLRRMASGNYEHWCRCGHFQVISKEMVK